MAITINATKIQKSNISISIACPKSFFAFKKTSSTLTYSTNSVDAGHIDDAALRLDKVRCGQHGHAHK